jgi:hypothetical protein
MAAHQLFARRASNALGHLCSLAANEDVRVPAPALGNGAGDRRGVQIVWLVRNPPKQFKIFSRWAGAASLRMV